MIQSIVDILGPKHRDHRKLIQPLLGLKFTTECFSILEQELKMLITNLDKHVGNGTFNIDHDIHKYITDIIGSRFFSFK